MVWCDGQVEGRVSVAMAIDLSYQLPLLTSKIVLNGHCDRLGVFVLLSGRLAAVLRCERVDTC